MAEPNTFHLPFGEMTLILQDMSALWGLPFQGEPVGGIADPSDDHKLMSGLQSCWEGSQVYAPMRESPNTVCRS